MPQRFKDRHSNARVLIAGSGPSTATWIKKPLRPKYDVVMCANHAIFSMYDLVDYHLVLERSPDDIIKWMRSRANLDDVVHIVSHHSIDRYPKHHNIIPARREFNYTKPDIFNYDRGFMGRYGKGDECTVLLQSLHFAAIIGATNIDIIGHELCWDGDGFNDHFHGDMGYRNHQDHRQIAFPTTRVGTMMVGTKETTDQFVSTARQVRRAISDLFVPAGIMVTDYSKGLL